jgi:serine/threonine protein kinase/Tfp pilus assembly protein PilF
MSDTSLERDPIVQQHLDSVLRAAFGKARGAPEPPRAGDGAGHAADDDLPSARTSYQVLGEIARGGMGVVLRARDPELARDVAVKVLRESLAGDASTLRRFVEEARIVGQLQHPGIVPIYAFGRMADQRPCFAMKLIRGRTLAALLAERGSPAEERHRFLTVYEQVCQTMAYAHSRGVIHRDLKPSNVMVGAFGEVQIVDWGLAKVLARPSSVEGPCEGSTSERESRASALPEPAVATSRGADEPATAHSLVGAVMGTPAYMPPEQARGEVASIDERSDVFALGGILCEILTGHPPYQGDSAAARSAAEQVALDGARTRLAAVQDEPELAALCQRCLAPPREARPRHAGELAEELGAHRASLEARSRATQIAAAEARVKLANERKARRLTVGLAASIVLSVLVSAGAWLWVRRHAEQRRTQTAGHVNAALELAALQYGRASSSPELAPWQAALAEVERAQALLDAGEPSAGLVERTRELSARVREGLDGARRRVDLADSNQRLLARLEELRAPETDGPDATDWPRVEAAYASAFREHGLDVDAQPVEDVARELRERGLGVASALALDEWALARRRTQRPEEAERLTRIALAADPDPVRARVRSVLAAGDAAGLLETARSAALEALPVATLSLLGNALAASGAEEDALHVLRVAQRLRPGDYVSNVYLARLFWNRDYHESARYYAAALAVRPDDALVIREFGYLLEHYLLDAPRAIALYRRALAQRPRDATLKLYLGHALLSQGDVGGALAAYEETTRLDPERRTAWLGLVWCRREQGDPAAVVSACREAVRRFPGVGIEHALAQALADQGEWVAAIEAAGEALRVVRDVAPTHDVLRRAREALGDHAGAAEAAREVLRIAPDRLLTYRDLGLDLGDIVDLDTASSEVRRALQQDPTSPTRHAMLGVLLQEQGRYSEALFELRSALALSADDSTWTRPSENNLGEGLRLIRHERRVQGWLDELERLASIEPRFELVVLGIDEPRGSAEWAELALLALKRGRTLTAARMFERALAEGAGALGDPTEACRIEAAAAAATTGCGQTGESTGLEAGERARWLGQAASWMRDDLALRVEQVASADPGVRLRAARALGHWCHAPGLACVRGEEALVGLDPAEQRTWRGLWSEVEGLALRIREAAESRPR